MAVHTGAHKGAFGEGLCVGGFVALRTLQFGGEVGGVREFTVIPHDRLPRRNGFVGAQVAKGTGLRVGLILRNFVAETAHIVIGNKGRFSPLKIMAIGAFQTFLRVTGVVEVQTPIGFGRLAQMGGQGDARSQQGAECNCQE